MTDDELDNSHGLVKLGYAEGVGRFLESIHEMRRYVNDPSYTIDANGVLNSLQDWAEYTLKDQWSRWNMAERNPYVEYQQELQDAAQPHRDLSESLLDAAESAIHEARVEGYNRGLDAAIAGVIGVCRAPETVKKIRWRSGRYALEYIASVSSEGLRTSRGCDPEEWESHIEELVRKSNPVKQ